MEGDTHGSQQHTPARVNSVIQPSKLVYVHIIESSVFLKFSAKKKSQVAIQ